MPGKAAKAGSFLFPTIIGREGTDLIAVKELRMCPTWYALAAGLLVGQTPEITTLDSTGWTQVQTSTPTRTWTQSGVWTPSTGWTWHNAVETSSDNVGNDKSATNRTILSRFSDRLSGLFGSRQSNASQPVARHNSGWQSTGWHDEGDAPLPVITSRSPSGRVTTEEPPLLEAAGAQPSTAASAPAGDIKAASFAPAPERNDSDKAVKIRSALLGKIGHAEDYSWIIGQIEISNGAHVVHYAAPNSHDHFGGKMILNGEVDLSHVMSGDLVAVHGSVIPGRMVSLYRVQAINVIGQGGK
jgi:hypothetical protein